MCILKYNNFELLLKWHLFIQVADPDFECSEDDDEASAGQNQAQSLKCMEKNTNVDVVLQADKERREKARQDAVNKKEKDKEDR